MKPQSGVNMLALKHHSTAYFMLMSLKYLLFRLLPIPPEMQTPGGATMRFECVREMFAFEYQVTTNKILHVSS